jgi:hypothetical protein
MNREETIDYLVKCQEVWAVLISIGEWSFQDDKYIHPDYDPITLHDWNRAKIVPYTKVRILSPEHSEYVQKLAFETGVQWQHDHTGEAKYTDQYGLFVYDKIMTYVACVCEFDRKQSKEIFIEMPVKTELPETGKNSRWTPTIDVKDERKAMEVIRDTARRVNARILAEKVGAKHDQGKPRYDLIPVHAEAEFVDVLTFGATKYAPNQWRNVKGARERYIAAAMRHIAAYRMGETHDPESGKHHLAHALCCMAFIIELDLEDKE